MHMLSPLSQASNFFQLNSLEIITTGDGSHSLLNKALNETYHSVHGAVRESEYVFIEKGLQYWIDHNTTPVIKIFEVGFGTGLNVLLTLLYKSNLKIEYTTLEAFPLEEEVWSVLNYAVGGEKLLFNSLHSSKWNHSSEINAKFTLHKIKNKLELVNLVPENYDLIFFDAFAPSKQPEMWELPMLKKIFDSMTNKGVFVTYCAKGQLKRDLKNLGFTVETLPGPPGKKEMVRAIKN
jgi:tRNA U34 5-methylaminomethyl-2-thiouridine-forming methyltransferase MnmC